MGLFSGSKTIVVSSTVYNLAGDEATRPDFLKNSIYGAVMSPYNHYLGETIVRNLLSGPGMNQRNFFKWALRQDYPGLPTYSVSREKPVDPSVVAPFITTPPSPSGLLLNMQSAHIISGDYEPLVEQYVLENYPDNYDTAYVSSYDTVTGDITIQWFGGGSVSFSAGGYTPDKTYVVANYFHYLAADVAALVTGSTTVGVLTKPSTTGYGLDGSSNRGVTDYVMTYDTRVVTAYTGSEPPTLPVDTDVTTPDGETVGFDGLDETWSKVTYEGGSGDDQETVNREHFLEIYEYRQIYTDTTTVSVVVNEDTPVAGQTQTITTTRIGDHLRPIFDWRIDTQDTTLLQIVDGSHVFIYEEGTGEATLDALIVDVTVTEEEAEYFPFMPIRLKNKSITHADYDDITGSGLYELTNRAYRRASGGGQRFSRLVDEVEDNPDIGDIDYAFTHHGVEMNVIEPACRKYMYTWFKNVSAHQTTTSGYMGTYMTAVGVYLGQVAAMNTWIYDQGDSARPGYGDPPPTVAKLITLESNTVRLVCEDTQLKNLDMRISWVNIDETLHSGAPTNPDTAVTAVIGDIWWEEGTDFEWDVTTGVPAKPGEYGGGATTKSHSVEKLYLYWQTGTNNYKKLTMWGLVHRNYVYGGEDVKTKGKEAINDPDPTGFLVPLHYPTVKALGLKDSTQMATANTYIVFNSYEVVKQKWYQGFIGMLIIFLVIIVISVVFPPLGAAGGSGILGANAAVGAAMGLTGTAAIVAGAIANALVAIAISQIITAGSTAIFGEKWGAIVGAVVNLAVSFGVAGGFDFQNLGELLTTENIMKITSAIANGYEGYVRGSVAEIADEMEERQEDYQGEMRDIDKMLNELRGNSGLNFDPLSLTDSVKGNARSAESGSYVPETLDQFIHRTTMTGSDIVDVNLSMVNNFADLSMELPS